MEIYYVKIIESSVVILIFSLSMLLIQKLINKRILEKVVQKSRGILITNTISIIATLIFLAILLIIWGVNQSELVVFVGSVLTVIGVAMFAQWSILSNITAGLVLFFNHSVKVDDTIAIMEAKDYEIQGKVLEIGLFFVTLKIRETDQEISLPNNIFIQKTIKKL